VIVLVLSAVPEGLRGHVTRWLMEISPGRAVMVYRARNEQGLAFLTWGDPWQPVDFEGLTLMMHPYYSEGRGQYSEPDPASRLRKRPAVSKFQRRRSSQGFPKSDRFGA